MSYITTYTRKHFDPVNPDPRLICIEDIAHALSMICRGNGHVSTFLRRGENKIERVAGASVLKDFMDQTVRPSSKDLMLPMLDAVDKILTDVPVYRLSCDISQNAVLTAKTAMAGE